LLSGDRVLAERFEPMAKGQAERLMPLIEEVLAEAGTPLQALSAIGVGVGPGNFTGLRIAVSAARGLALGLGVPAIGVTMFEACYGQRRTDLSAIVALPGPRDTLYVQQMAPVLSSPAVITGSEDIGEDRFDLVVTTAREAIPDWLLSRTKAIAGAEPVARSIGRIAATRMDTPQPRPTPVYVRPADAAPSKDKVPVILPC
jgi:tRNA threonylcarbamoyladenosine biosynthesis protein TsaB